MATVRSRALTGESLTPVDMTIQLARLYNNVNYLTCGGMGHVFIAADTLNIAKVLKVTQVHALDEVNAITEEFNVMVTLNHPHIAQVYNFFSVDNVLGFEMKVYPSGDLHNAILLKTFTLTQKLVLASEILSGLACVHSKRIVHRDIKPANILLDAGCRAAISDFGLATHVQNIISGDVVGTAGYIAPEVLSCKKYDTKSDIWSFAVVLYAVISSKPNDPIHVRSETLPSALKELVKNADAEQPHYRKSAQWCTNIIYAARIAPQSLLFTIHMRAQMNAYGNEKLSSVTNHDRCLVTLFVY